MNRDHFPAFLLHLFIRRFHPQRRRCLLFSFAHSLAHFKFTTHSERDFAFLFFEWNGAYYFKTQRKRDKKTQPISVKKNYEKKKKQKQLRSTQSGKKKRNEKAQRTTINNERETDIPSRSVFMLLLCRH